MSDPHYRSTDVAESVAKTGTTTVALTAADAVVMATDMRASAAGRFVLNKAVRKVERVHPTAALTMAGPVGGMQSFVRSLRSEAALYEARRGEDLDVDALATLAGNLLRNGPYRAAQPTLGGVDADGPRVYDLDAGGGVVAADYVANGSGMQLAYGLLEEHYEGDLPVEEATRVAARAVRSAVERDTASGNGVVLAELTDDGVEISDHDDFAEVV